MIITMKERTCFFNRFLQVSIFLLISTLNFRNRFYSCRKWACLTLQPWEKELSTTRENKNVFFQIKLQGVPKTHFQNFQGYVGGPNFGYLEQVSQQLSFRPVLVFLAILAFFWFILASFCLYWPFWLFWIYLIIFFSVFFWLFWLFGHKKITKNNQKQPTIIKNNQNNQIYPKMTKNNQK